MIDLVLFNRSWTTTVIMQSCNHQIMTKWVLTSYLGQIFLLDPMIIHLGCQNTDSTSSSPLGLACGACVALEWLSRFNFCHPIVRSLVSTQVKIGKHWNKTTWQEVLWMDARKKCSCPPCHWSPSCPMYMSQSPPDKRCQNRRRFRNVVSRLYDIYVLYHWCWWSK